MDLDPVRDMDHRVHKVASLVDLPGRDEISTLNLFKDIFIEHGIVKFRPHILEPNFTFFLNLFTFFLSKKKIVYS